MKNSVSENRTECIRQAKIVHEWHGHREFLASSNLENSRQYLLLENMSYGKQAEPPGKSII